MQTNRELARFLDRWSRERPLFPRDRLARQAVEEAERFGDEIFQMAARRIVLAAALHDPPPLYEYADDGPLGSILSKRRSVRRGIFRAAGRYFKVTQEAERELLAGLPALLDQIDDWVTSCVLGTPEPNAADFMIAPSVALLFYRTDLVDAVAGRPCVELARRLVPWSGYPGARSPTSVEAA